MIKHFWLGFLLALLACSMANAKVSPFIGVNLGIFSDNSELSTSIMGGGQFGLTADYLAGSLSFLYYSKENKVNTLSKGNFSLTPIMFNVFGRIPLKSQKEKEIAALRLGGGFSYILVGHEVDPAIQTAGLKYSENVDNGIGYQISTGIDFWFGNNITFGADIIYLLFNPKIKSTLSNNAAATSTNTTSDIRLDTVLWLASVKYHFN